MLNLLIEASTECGIVAIFNNQTMIFYEALPFGYNNSQYLLPTVEKGLKQLNLKPQELQLITAGVGPGSYTGIRVGASTAKTLAYVCKLPLVGICSLIGFIPNVDGSFAALIDAKISGVYLLKGIKQGDCIHYTTAPEVCEIEKLHEKLIDVEVLVTPHSKRLQPLLQKRYPTSTWQWLESYPSPLQMNQCAIENFRAGHYSVNSQLELLYLRKTQAEIEKGKI